jgi:DUF2892 family protein
MGQAGACVMLVPSAYPRSRWRFEMNCNEGKLDRAVRAVIGVGLIAATLLGAIGPWGWIGLVPLATAAIGWCPLYGMLGIDTCGMRK